MGTVTLPGGTSVDFAAPLHAVDRLEPAYASWTMRVVAAVVDAVIAAGVAFLAPIGVGTTFPFLGQPASLTGLNPLVGSWFRNPWVVAVVVVTIVMQAYLGVTPGKVLVGIAVVSESDARPIGLVRTLLRWLAHVVDGILFIGYLRPLWNSRRKTFADSAVGSVVLVTRRPRPHRWLISRSAPDVGPPSTWEAAATPRWRRAATWLSVLAVGLGGLFTFAPSTRVDPAPTDLTCTMTRLDAGAARLTHATLHAITSTGLVTRLGVTRRLDVTPQGVWADWTWAGTLSPNDEVTFRLVVTAADGTPTTHDFPFFNTSTSFATMQVPSNALQGVGDRWSWAASVIVNGVESPACVGHVSGFLT